MKKKILIVVADYYKKISNSLLRSAQSKLQGVYSISVIKVPGVFEIPVTISKNIKKFDAFLALGCVIKGQTPHFDFVSSASTDAIMQLSIRCKKRVGSGMLTCLNMRQAKARIKKGLEASSAIISVLNQ